MSVFLCGNAFSNAVQPNFIVIVFDDLGWEDIGAYGNPYVKTPVMDRLAASGATFNNAYLTSSSCTSSRASILTSRYPHNTGAAALGDTVPASQLLLPSVLRDAGYFTASLGKWHIGTDTQAQFDRVEDDNLDGTRTWLAALQDRPQNKPFFLWLASHDPHVPYAPLTKNSVHQPQSVMVPPYLPDTPAVREQLARYYNEIANTDAVIGRVYRELDQQGLLESTWIFILTDNGAPFPRAKLNLYDSGIKTPLLVVGPGLAAGARQGMVSSIDLMPTILDLAGLLVPDSAQGYSFRPLLEEIDKKGRDYIIAEQNAHIEPMSKRAVRSQQFLYIRNLQQEGRHCSFEAGLRSHLVKLFRKGQLTQAQQGCFRKSRPSEELYVVTEDPYSLHNVVSDDQYAPDLQVMRQRMAQWARETSDTAWLESENSAR